MLEVALVTSMALLAQAPEWLVLVVAVLEIMYLMEQAVQPILAEVEVHTMGLVGLVLSFFGMLILCLRQLAQLEARQLQ
jgi:hypothetical protein